MLKGEPPDSGYRADIDGLRALAVLAVIGFHASPRFVPGGYVGVDVFFVISGFLISGIVLAQLLEDRFTFADFYARRIRRIFPSLIVVLLACLAVGWFVLVDEEFAQLLKHAAASAAFVPNIVFWQEGGYFDAPSELKPLLHLWSLGIEEQFYLLWPPLLYVCWKHGLNVLTAAALIVAVSLAINLGLVRESATAAFFLPHARIWELLLGGMLAYAERVRRDDFEGVVNRLVFAPGRMPDARLLANLKAWSGLALIVVGIAGFSRSTAFPGWWFGAPLLSEVASFLGLDRGMIYPGWWAAVPTMGTALVISAGAGAWVNRTLLSPRPIVFIGLISYPLYMWHWPLLSFLQITESGTPTRSLRLAAVALSFLLAWITYAGIERPIRRSMSRRTPWRILSLTATLGMIGCAAAAGYATGALNPRIARFATKAAPGETRSYETPNCRGRFDVPGEYCEEYAPGSRVTTALLGDSHAGHFLTGLGEALARHGEGVVHLGDSGCPPLFDIERYEEGFRFTCRADNAAILQAVGANGQLRRVVLAFRGAFNVSGAGFGRLDNEAGVASYRIAGTEMSPSESVARALLRTARYFLDRGRDVCVILQVPELGFRLGECVGRPFSFNRTLRNPCAVARAEVETRQAVYRQIVADVKQQLPALRVVDPMTRLCDARWCYGVIDGEVLYRDSNHLSTAGSAFLADILAPSINRAASRPADPLALPATRDATPLRPRRSTTVRRRRRRSTEARRRR